MSVKWYGGKAKAQAREGALEGVRDGARVMFEASQKAVPVQSGELKRSGKVRVDASALKAEVSYGEGLPDARAVIIHEKLEIHHDDGSPKYLENPSRAAAPQIGSNIAAAVRRKL